jgi:DNA-binding transcriptional ArsR family regulator
MRVLTTNAFAGIGALVGDPARASMLMCLMDGRALTATELAACAGVTPQTASSHLARMVAAGLLAMERQGRHRYHRIAGPAIAQMVEGMMVVAAGTTDGPSAAARTGPKDQALRQARTCYDHLAGRLAVAIADALLARGDVEFGPDGGGLTASGAAFLGDAGIAVGRDDGAARRRIFCRPCLDWSERRPHLAGHIGAVLLDHFVTHDWIRRTPATRAVRVTPPGRRHLAAMFDLDDSLWQRVD